jgi:hypothetical protein
MAYVAVTPPTIGTPISTTDFGIPVANNQADHETRILAVEADVIALQGTGIFLIEEIVAGSSDTTITFSTIPQTYSELRLTGDARHVYADVATSLLVRFNGDTGANYDGQGLYGVDDIVGEPSLSAQTSLIPGYISAATAPAGVSTSFEIVMPNYSGITFNKTAMTRLNHKRGTANGSYFTTVHSGFWRSSSAITQIDLLGGGAGAFLTGSIFRLYGIV